jgi:hypothetical protein
VLVREASGRDDLAVCVGADITKGMPCARTARWSGCHRRIAPTESEIIVTRVGFGGATGVGGEAATEPVTTSATTTPANETAGA